MIKRRRLLVGSLGLPMLPLMMSGCSQDSGEANPYLLGNYASVADESTYTDLQVTGTIPAELEGRFLRNGPNAVGADPSNYHWFTGRGMVHGMRLRDGKAEWYRNRYVGGASPNTNVIGHAGRTMAIVESGGMAQDMSYELDSLGDNSSMGIGYTAHPKYDAKTGELHAMCYDWANLKDHIRYVVVDANGEWADETEIPLPGMPMIHDMSLTENYAVIFDLPVTLSFIALATGASFPFRWDDEYEPRVGLLPRGGSPEDIIWRGITQNYAYHPMNAYEDIAGNVVIDIVRYDRMFDRDVYGPFGDSAPRLDRWTINPRDEVGANVVKEETIDERAQEFPRCHPDLNGRPYRYGYTVASADHTFPGIYKHDLQTGRATQFDIGAGRHAGEPVFIPKEGIVGEDDGYIMSLVYDEGKHTSELLILDAQDMARPAIAQVHIPSRVPYGFHGNWIPDAVVGPTT